MGDVTRPVLIATGTKREAAALGKLPGLLIIPGGGDGDMLRARLNDAADGASAIISFGFAGALTGDLAIGDWVVADRLVGTLEAPCNSEWTAMLTAALPGAQTGCIYADGRLISNATEKQMLGQRHGAIAADMESHIAAAAAAAHDLPFAIIRCISDGARHQLPPAIAVAMRPGGGMNVTAILASLARQPGQIPHLIRTVTGFAKAMASLRHGASRIAAALKSEMTLS